MTQYVKREMNDLHGTGEKKLYYTIPLHRNMDEEDVLEWMRDNNMGLTKGMAADVFRAAASALASLMSMGYSVTLRGIGTFRPRLGLVEGAEPELLDSGEEQRNARSLRVCGVNFKPDRGLVAATDLRCRLESGGVVGLYRSALSREERVERAVDYLRSHPLMRVDDYARLTGLSKTTAGRELRALRAEADCPFSSAGRGSHRTYVLRS